MHVHDLITLGLESLHFFVKHPSESDVNIVRDDTYATSVLICYLKVRDNPVNCMHTQQLYACITVINQSIVL